MSTPRAEVSGSAFSPGWHNQLSGLGESWLRDLQPAERLEWDAISRESDAALLSASLYKFANRLERTGRVAAALPLYEQITRFLGDSGSSRRARERIRLWEGGGRFSERFEFELKNLVAGATDPAALGAMAFAGIAFQGLRAATLSQLLASPQAGLLTRGVGARSLAYTIGFSGEVPAFVLAERGLRRTFKKEPRSGELPLGDALARNTLHLGLLKGASGIARKVSPSPWVSQTGLFGAALMGHASESLLGWSPTLDARGLWSASLLSWLHFQSGGSIAHAVLGPRFTAWNQELAWRSQLLGTGMPGAWTGHVQTYAHAGGEPRYLPGSSSKVSSPLPYVLFNADQREGSSSDLQTVTRRFGERLGKALGQDADAPPLRKIHEQVAKTPPGTREVYADFLLKTTEQELKHSSEETVQTMLLGATSVFAHVTELNPLRRVRGSFYDSMVQEGFERSLNEGSLQAFGSLARIVVRSPDVATLERFYSQSGWQGRYGLELLISAAPTPLPERWQSAVNALRLEPAQGMDSASQLTRRLISDYLKAYHANKIPPEWRSPLRNHALFSDGQGKVGPLAMDLPLLSRGLFGMSELLNSDPAWAPVLSAVATRAYHSPVPIMYFDRLFKVLASDGLREHLGDLAYSKPFQLSQVRASYQAEAARRDWRAAGARLNGQFETGFVYDPMFAVKLAGFYQHLPEMLEPGRALQRRFAFHAKALDLLEQRSQGRRALGDRALQENFHPMDIVELLDFQHTPISRKAREAFVRGEIDLALLSYQQMQDLWSRQEQSKVSTLPALSIFLPASRSDTGRPTVAVTAASPSLTREEKAHRAIRLAAWTVHEYEHYLHHRSLPFQTEEGLLRAEMRASLEELYFYVRNGELSEWAKVAPVAGEGLGMYLRNRVEQDYLAEPRLLLARPR